MAQKLNINVIIDGKLSIILEVDQKTLEVCHKPVSGKFRITTNQASITCNNHTIDIISVKN